MKQYVNTYNKNYEIYEFRCSIKLIITTNRARFNKINSRSNSHHRLHTPKKLILSEIHRDRYYFSQIIEMRISFISLISHMTYDYYFEQPKSMGGKKLNQILSKNPKLINCLNRNTCHPLIRKYSNTPFNKHE